MLKLPRSEPNDVSFVKMLAHLTHCAYWYCWMLYISYILSLGASASSSFCWIRRLVPSLHSDHGGPVNRVPDGAKRRKRAYSALPRQHWAKETMDKNSPNSFWRERERETKKKSKKYSPKLTKRSQHCPMRPSPQWV